MFLLFGEKWYKTYYYRKYRNPAQSEDVYSTNIYPEHNSIIKYDFILNPKYIINADIDFCLVDEAIDIYNDLNNTDYNIDDVAQIEKDDINVLQLKFVTNPNIITDIIEYYNYDERNLPIFCRKNYFKIYHFCLCGKTPELNQVLEKMHYVLKTIKL